jgi:hypothetical protein
MPGGAPDGAGDRLNGSVKPSDWPREVGSDHPGLKSRPSNFGHLTLCSSFSLELEGPDFLGYLTQRVIETLLVVEVKGGTACLVKISNCRSCRETC